MAEINVGILGLGRVGASIALALQRNNADPKARNRFIVTAYTADPDTAKAARERGIAKKITQKVSEAARNMDILFMALPYAEVRAAYEIIAYDVRSGVVVFDTTPLKGQAQGWSGKYLPQGAHVVGVTPVINPRRIYNGLDTLDAAGEDLFDGGVLFLMPGVQCAPEAIDLGSDIAGILGATPQFIDPLENDSLLTATELLPALVGVGYYWMMMQSQGWKDAQRMTNEAFAMFSHPLFDTHPDDLSAQFTDSRETLARYLSQLIHTLENLRRVLDEDDRDALMAVMASASKDYEAWINRRTNNKWDQTGRSYTDDAPGMMSALLGGWAANKLRRGQKNENE